MRNSSPGRVIAAPGSTRAPRRSGVHDGRFALRQCRVRDRHCPAQGPTAASALSSIAGETGAVEEVIGRRFVRDYPAVVATAVSIGVVPAGSVPAGSVPAGSVAAASEDGRGSEVVSAEDHRGEDPERVGPAREHHVHLQLDRFRLSRRRQRRPRGVEDQPSAGAGGGGQCHRAGCRDSAHHRRRQHTSFLSRPPHRQTRGCSTSRPDGAQSVTESSRTWPISTAHSRSVNCSTALARWRR